jgi:hypothetical protein
MSSKKKILIQLDSDPMPSVFDRVVAVDAGADHVFSYGGVTPDQVRDLVYGAIFTRGPDDLKSTALFVGGSDVTRAEENFKRARGSFLGPLRVSALLDCAGANTTAAAAVVAAHRSLPLEDTRALVLAATGPVGRRVARLLARRGAQVRVASRQLDRSTQVAENVRAVVGGARVQPVAVEGIKDLEAALAGINLVVAAGGPGVQLLPREQRLRAATTPMASTLRMVIDLNAVPPVGIEGVEPTDSGVERDGMITYGAIGVGGIKMKIHKAAVARLFESRDVLLDAEEVLELGLSL